MNLLAPGFLWTFLALIPLGAIYFLKVRPRRRDTTAYFLWEKIFQEKRTSSLFSRLRDLLSLLILALVFSAIALSLAKPEFSQDERKDLLILIDQSASMSADDGGQTRLERARAAAADIIRGLDGTQRAAIASVARGVTYYSHLSDSPRDLMAAVEQVAETDLPFDPASLDSIGAGEDSSGAENHRVLFITDGCQAGDGELPGSVERIKVGSPTGNVGISAADLQFIPGEGTRRLGLYFQIVSSFDSVVEADLVVERQDSGTIAKLIPLQIQPGVNPAEVFEVDYAEPGRWLARIEIDDALPKDNQAYLVAPEHKPIPVSVAANDRFFFESCVQAFSGNEGILSLSEEPGQLVLAQASSPDAPLAIIFNPTGDSPWWTGLGGPVEGDIVPLVAVADHPTLRHLDASTMPFVGARVLDAPDGSLVLVESDRGVPLVYQISAGGRSALVINMDPLAGEFYLSAWFPVLVHSAATHLAGRQDAIPATVRPGEPIPIPGAGEDEQTEVTYAGSESPELVSGTSLDSVPTLGFLEFNNDGGRWPAAASLLSAEESLLDNTSVEQTAIALSRGASPAAILIALAIVLLILESILYHRRKVG